VFPHLRTLALFDFEHTETLLPYVKPPQIEINTKHLTVFDCLVALVAIH
jgi:hypothetical protein